jgi:DNA primase
MNNEAKDLIKQKLDIVDVVGEYITLIPAGSNYKALSPFRNEKTPSFIVSPELQIYKDFGGDRSGDIFQFIMDIEGVSFIEALNILSQKAGISIKSYNKNSEFQVDNKKIILQILNDSTKIYHSILKHMQYGQRGRDYLNSRGITDDLIDLFEIGLAPQSYHTLSKKLSQKYSNTDIEASGMAISSDKNNIYDRFRGRVMIPIQDTLGRVVGFTGRVLPEYDDGKMGKYVNSPQTIVFDKSKILFGLSQAKIAIKSHNRVIIVEGQMDVIMSHKAGVKEVVAVSGTALTEQHITTLLRYTNQFILAFDNDKAGISACLRSAALITKKGGIVKVITIDGGKDTADLVRENSELWISAIEKSSDFIEYYINHIVSKIKPEDTPAKNQALQTLIAWIQDINDPITKNYYIKRLADLLNMSEKDIYSQLKINNIQGEVNVKNYNTDTPLIKLQKQIIAYLLYKPTNHDILILEQSLFTQPKLRDLFIKLRKYCSQNSPQKLNLVECKGFLSEVEYETLEELLLPIFYKIEQLQPSESQIQQTIQENILLLKNQYKSLARKTLLKQLKEAKKLGDNTKIQEILKKYKKFT